MNLPRWLLTRLMTSRLRPTVAGSGLLLFLLVLPIALVFVTAADALRWAVLAQAVTQAGLFAGLLAALRLRLPVNETGSPWRQELRAAVLVGAIAWLAAALAILIGRLANLVVDLLQGTTRIGPIPEPSLAGDGGWTALVAMLVISTFATVASIFAFLITRGVLFGIRRWDQLRRTRLRWAIANSLLIVSVSVAILIALFLSIATVVSGTDDGFMSGLLPSDASAIERALAVIVFNYVPAIVVLFLTMVIVSVIIVSPVALIAFPVIGRATSRIEALATATSAVRAGDLSARTPVTGEDEIARLQADFNAMAADLERTLGELREERDAVNRLLNARRELIASVSHELRTPLATLRGYLDSAMEHWDETSSPTLRQDLEIMSGETDRLHRLVDDLFILSRAEIGRLPLAVAPADVGPLLQRIAEAAVPLAWTRGRVEVVSRIPGSLPPVLADPERLEQIIWNLITNAVRHTPPGGLVLIGADLTDGHLEIEVRDTGEGIEPAELPLVWDRFYRASNARDRAGAGLGLALVRELTEAMGGSVAVESQPGEGSRFSIRLPLAQAHVASAPVHSLAG